MDKLILENVRCFKGRHEIPLAPLTLLIGENSTGKSTLLSAVRLAWDIFNGESDPDFNEEPFDWGAFEQIVHFREHNGKHAKEFKIGFGLNFEGLLKSQDFFESTFLQEGVHPMLSELNLFSGDFSIKTIINPKKNIKSITIEKSNEREVLSYEEKDSVCDPDAISILSSIRNKSKLISENDKRHLLVEMSMSLHSDRPYAIAPIRTKPRRTYDWRRETQRPEGDHIPMVLASARSLQPERWKILKNDLESFGVQSGLFSSIQTKALGSESDPFQVQVVMEGFPVNLIDAGYGISQVLPIIVDCLLSERGKGQILLMQQPEVHLHPKAQAALGSFFGTITKQHDKQLIIETHSDHLIDRIRMDVRDGKNLKAEDVIFLYFEREGSDVKIHPINLDSAGNLINVPPDYRRFFLEEQERFLAG